MSWVLATDPLALVAIQAGQVNTPASQTGATGGGRLDTQQRAVALGEPVPIVFARRRNDKGGILISPGATEARFENDTSNAVTAFYHLVLSEGQIDSIPVKDVFQRSCRVGSYSQTYNRRAGTWTPGNAIVARAGYDMPECPYYCGTVGAYPGMSTLSFSVTIPNGFDQWNRQVHCLIRGGMHVTRLVDSVFGPSDNFADLINWMLSNSARVPTALVDTTALGVAAGFLEANGFTCNCWLTEAQNYSDLLAKWAPYFLLGESNNGGKKGLRPLLPINSNGTIKTTAITPVYTFTEDTILPGSLEIQYSTLAERQPFVVQVTWRQQLEDDFGIIRTAEVRYAGTAESGPYESHDLSAFCTSEDHAVKVGAYILAKRVYPTHTVRFSARPQTHNTIVSPGDIVRVRLLRQATAAGQTYHDHLYQVERISKTLAGDVSYECTHFPIDSQGRSLVALDVAAATGTGILLTSNKTGVGCDINSSTDNTIPSETWSSADWSVLNAGEEQLLPLASQGQYGLNGVLSFDSVVVNATADPNVYQAIVAASTTPPPGNPTDNLDQFPLPSDQLKITLSNGQFFYIPPVVQPATTSQGQLVFEDNISGQTLPLTRIYTVSAWSGGGFANLNTSATLSYTIQAPAGPVVVEARMVSGAAALVTENCTAAPPYSPYIIPVAATGGPSGGPYIATANNSNFYGMNISSSQLASVGTQDFTFTMQLKWLFPSTGTNSDTPVVFGNSSQFQVSLLSRNRGITGYYLDSSFKQIYYQALGVATSTWHTVKLVRNSSYFYMYLNGTLLTPNFVDAGINYGDSFGTNSVLNVLSFDSAVKTDIGKIQMIIGQAIL